MNDTTELWEDNFQDACIDKMIEMLEENGIYVSNLVEVYLVDMFEGYGFEWGVDDETLYRISRYSISWIRS